MADQNTGVERERIGTRIDEEITGLESREERDRVGSFADTERLSRPRVTASTASTPTAAQRFAHARDSSGDRADPRGSLRDSQCHPGSAATVDAGVECRGQREGCGSRAFP